MIKTTIETIDGQLHNVFWHKLPCWAESIDTDVKWRKTNFGFIGHNTHSDEHIATALLALPSKPNLEHANRLYRYVSEGLYPAGIWYSYYDNKECSFGPVRKKERGSIPLYMLRRPNVGIEQITHVIDAKGNRIEIANE